jgi:hypothetical protein
MLEIENKSMNYELQARFEYDNMKRKKKRKEIKLKFNVFGSTTSCKN